MDLVSIIIPVYNREKMIQEAIKSCINQSYKNIEIIVVNDGSTDNTAKVVEQIQTYCPKIKLINQNNQGVSKSRITGLKHANGEYVMFLDSDDLISKDYVLLLINTIKSANSSVVLARRFQEMGLLRILYNKYPIFMDLEKSKHYLPTMWVGVNCKLYSRKNVNLLDFGLKANEDLAFNYYDLASKRYIACNNDAIYIQRFAHDSLAKNYIYGNLYHIDNTLKPLEIEKKLFLESGLDAKYNEELEAVFIKNIFERIFNAYTSKISKEQKDDLTLCLLKYLNYYYPNWKNNKYYKEHFRGFSLDYKMYVILASMFVKNISTTEEKGYEETLNDFNAILMYK